MIHISESDIKGFERFYRANLINSISGYKPAMLIGTANEKGLTNLAMFSSIVHLGADPALIGFIQRPLGQSGHTYYNIKETNCYTINHVHEGIVDQAHFTSARFAPEVSEFEACALTPAYISGFNAPFVKEAKVKMGLEFVEEMPIKRNNTILVIGQIKYILLQEGCLEVNGNINLQHAATVASSGLENYNLVRHFKSLPYAHADEIPKF